MHAFSCAEDVAEASGQELFPTLVLRTAAAHPVAASDDRLPVNPPMNAFGMHLAFLPTRESADEDSWKQGPRRSRAKV